MVSRQHGNSDDLRLGGLRLEQERRERCRTDPPTHDVGADVRLILMVRADNLDFHPLSPQRQSPRPPCARRSLRRAQRNKSPDLSFITRILMISSVYWACAIPVPHPSARNSVPKLTTRFTAVAPNGVAYARHEIRCCRGPQSTNAHSR